MIFPSELRIGNWVNIDNNQTTVCHIMGDEDYFKPIPLTPEILKKCGFEVLQADGTMNKTIAYNGYLAISTYTDDCKYWKIKNYYAGTNAKIKYLHQLQNLYYALTDKELNYQP